MSLTNPQKIAVANIANIKDVIELLNECKTNIPSLIGKDLFDTSKNAITAEVEAMLVANFVQYLSDIKQNNFHDTTSHDEG